MDFAYMEILINLQMYDIMSLKDYIFFLIPKLNENIPSWLMWKLARNRSRITNSHGVYGMTMKKRPSTSP